MFKLPKQNHRKVTKGRFSHFNEEASPGTPLYRKKLDQSIQAEANDDGTIFIDVSVEPGSAQERQILAHEMRHLVDMKTGKLRYDDNWIKYNGMEYPRKNGFILYEGEWVPEGGKQFPWEQH
tara:strand:- start:1467 stop:1832 length:366 start_codon:yes stop_codon:yes gene_type:complete